MKRKVVVTGIGLVTPVGIGTEPTWDSLMQGKSGVGLITKFDTTQFSTKIAAELKGFDPSEEPAADRMGSPRRSRQYAGRRQRAGARPRTFIL